jgi:cell division septum initiation protein DivIVA
VVDNLKNRTDEIAAEIGKLAYERLQLTRRVAEIDEALGQLEGGQVANSMVQKDVNVRETIAQARREAEERRAAEAAQAKPTTEVTSNA